MSLSWLLHSVFYIFLVFKSGEESEEFDDLNSSNVFLKKNNKLKKKGRKCQRSETLVNDLVDIILENDKNRQKFLMTNKYKEWKVRSVFGLRCKGIEGERCRLR